MLDTFYKALSAIGFVDPIHPTQVHMPIGLVIGSFVFGLFALLSRRTGPALAARYCTVLALLFMFPTVAAGVMDWLHFYSGVWLFPIKVKVGLACLLFVLLVLAILVGRNRQEVSAVLLGVYVLSFFTVVALGYFGGRIVYGMRSVSTPERYRSGEAIFMKNCSGCHPNGGNVIKPDHPVRGSDKLASLDAFTAWIRNPEAPMPAFTPQMISDAQAKGLYDYVANSFKGNGRSGTGRDRAR